MNLEKKIVRLKLVKFYSDHLLEFIERQELLYGLI